MDPLMERLAALEHDQWLAWAMTVVGEVSPERRGRWMTYFKSYDELSEEAKELDRGWVRKALHIIGAADVSELLKLIAATE